MLCLFRNYCSFVFNGMLAALATKHYKRNYSYSFYYIHADQFFKACRQIKYRHACGFSNYIYEILLNHLCRIRMFRIYHNLHNNHQYFQYNSKL